MARGYDWLKTKEMVILERFGQSTSSFIASLQAAKIPPGLERLKARIKFILKTGRAFSKTVKDFRPINLILFILKIFQRLINTYPWEAFFVKNPSPQGAKCLSGKSIYSDEASKSSKTFKQICLVVLASTQ